MYLLGYALQKKGTRTAVKKEKLSNFSYKATNFDKIAYKFYRIRYNKWELLVTRNQVKGGNLMAEQEKLKKMLRRMIDDTESHKINSSEELIQLLITELSTTKSLEKYTHALAK